MLKYAGSQASCLHGVTSFRILTRQFVTTLDPLNFAIELLLLAVGAGKTDIIGFTASVVSRYTRRY
jgi:hypothetical protein